MAWHAYPNKIYYATTNGRSWFPYNWAKRVVYQGEPLAYYQSNSMAADNFGNVHIVFWTEDTATGAKHIKVLNSTDHGLNFDPPVDINSLPLNAPSVSTSIATDASGGIHVTWGDGVTQYYAKGSPNGQSWSDQVAINVTLPVGNNASLATTQDGTGIYVVWRSTGIVCAYSNNSGDIDTWAESVVNSNSGSPLSKVSTAVSPTGEVSVAYNLGYELLLSRSLSQGANWEQTVVMEDAAYAITPNLAVGADNKAHIMWDDDLFIAYTHEQ